MAIDRFKTMDEHVLNNDHLEDGTQLDLGSKATDRLIWWWFAGTRGGPTRARIVTALKYEPLNAKQLSDLLGLNYKTVRKHLKILGDHGFLVSFGEKYGKAYSPSPELIGKFDTLQEIQRTGRIKTLKQFNREMGFLG
ncbi:MAG TPA: winged helix-turn-helix domain-containing protein [Candidatus Bathyarchaeia archaeon]|nr:winged helix-turn-helix domain-containing protein [Candidatus Bathyarchaeia archaeon]